MVYPVSGHMLGFLENAFSDPLGALDLEDALLVIDEAGQQTPVRFLRIEERFPDGAKFVWTPFVVPRMCG